MSFKSILIYLRAFVLSFTFV